MDSALNLFLHYILLSFQVVKIIWGGGGKRYVPPNIFIGGGCPPPPNFDASGIVADPGFKKMGVRYAPPRAPHTGGGPLPGGPGGGAPGSSRVFQQIRAFKMVVRSCNFRV